MAGFRNSLIFVILFWMISFPLFSQNDSLRWKKPLVWSAYSVGMAGGSAALYQLWFSDYSNGKFHVFHDEKQWLQMDKAGHAFSAYTFAGFNQEVFQWAGYSRSRSSWYAGLSSFLFMTAIEVMDGFSAGWGFSPWDMGANTAGLGVFYLQDYLWKEQRIRIKFNFHPEQGYQYRPELMGSNFYSRLLKDYNSQNYWLSVNPASFGFLKAVPWFNLAFGYSASGMTGGSYNPSVNESGIAIPYSPRIRQFYLSPDIDWSRIPVKNKTLRQLLKVLSFYKLSLPAIGWDKNGINFNLLM